MIPDRTTGKIRSGSFSHFWQLHPRTADGLLIGLLTLGSVAVVPHLGATERVYPWFDGILGILPLIAATGLLFRRTRPTASLAVLTAVGWVSAALNAPQVPLLLSLAVVSVAVYHSARRALVGSLIVLMSTLLIEKLAHGHVDYSSVLLLSLTFGVTLGIALGNRRRYLLALLERAAHLEVERDQRAQIAAAAERARIAREMHDIVAHGLTVMIKMSDAADSMLHADLEASRKAVQLVGSTGRAALEDMRRVLGVLRTAADGEPPLAPQPEVFDLDRLIEEVRAGGLAIEYSRVGVCEQTASVQLVVFRTVQECLTNVMRHARFVQLVSVEVTCAPTEVVVEVRDDGEAGGFDRGSKRGILGLRERAALFGGRVDAGPRPEPERGWVTRLVLPLTAGDSQKGLGC